MTDYSNTLPFDLPKNVTITEKTDNYPVIVVNNDFAKAEIAVLGAHVLQYQPIDQEPLLWLSKQAIFEQGRAVRGGIPLCWPWFGDHPNDSSLPAHGFARTAQFELTGIKSSDNGETLITLRHENSDAHRNLWPHPFVLDVDISVGEKLSVSMTMTNHSPETLSFTSALHSYFNISDIKTTIIQGLDGTAYFDKVQDFAAFEQSGDITIDQEVDRVYVPTRSDVLIVDQGHKRTLRIAKSGSHSTVVWNPWIDKAAAMGDFNDDGYQNMVCVETSNALTDAISLGSGESHTISTHISAESTL